MIDSKVNAQMGAKVMCGKIIFSTLLGLLA